MPQRFYPGNSVLSDEKPDLIFRFSDHLFGELIAGYSEPQQVIKTYSFTVVTAVPNSIKKRFRGKYTPRPGLEPGQKIRNLLGCPLPYRDTTFTACLTKIVLIA